MPWTIAKVEREPKIRWFHKWRPIIGHLYEDDRPSVRPLDPVGRAVC